MPRGTWEKGVDDFEVLEAKGYPGYWDPVAQASWLFDGKTFWTYDNAASVANKMAYVDAQDLRGVRAAVDGLQVAQPVEGGDGLRVPA